MIPVPSNKRELLSFANELIDQCNISVAMRSSYYRQLNMIAETGRYDGTKALINMLNNQITFISDYLFSPVELMFSIDFGRPRPKIDYERAKAAAKELTRTWDRNNTDMTFGRGVKEAVKYGACILKQWAQVEGPNEDPVYYDKLVMPWQFGVFREDENRLERQEAMCETVTLTMPEVWRRICHLPEAKKLYEQIKSNAQTGTAAPGVDSNEHWVLSANPLNTSGVEGTTVPGGIVNVTSNANFGSMGPVIAPAVVVMHELWVKDDTDYVTIQVIEPDILLSPLHKKSNLLGLEGVNPYRLIQPNEVTNWFWGRSELVDLIEPQQLLATWCDDTKRLMGLQIDKILGISGDAGITDEIYAQMRVSGYMNLPQGADIKDITPKLPAELIPMLKFCIEMINTLGGRPEILQGKGEPGVRAGSHADTLMKTASPSLRDRSLLVERQCATCGDLTLQMMEAKDPERYWLKADKPIDDVDNSSFLLAELPDDWRVVIDSHSSSPIFADENAQLIFQGLKAGIVQPEYVLDNMPFPNKEIAKIQLREKQEHDAGQLKELLQSNPDVGNKLLEKKVGLHR
jgi:hypothetical protein